MYEEDPDWALWRSFAAVVAEGSLSAAARRLGLSQPTVGRHVEALEQTLRLTLFERTRNGFRPTEAGLRMYEPVAAAAEALSAAMLMAQSGQAALEGTVRITASNVAANYILPPMLARLRAEFPAIDLELVPSDSAENLLLREADIAVRMFRPTQLELIAKKLGESPVVACAHESYLARRGTPRGFDELRAHDLIGFDRSTLMIEAARMAGVEIARGDFAIRTDGQTAMWELIRAGAGIGFGQRLLVRATPGLVEVDAGIAVPPLEVWLATHRELFTSRRIRAIYDRLGELLADFLVSDTAGPGR